MHNLVKKLLQIKQRYYIKIYQIQNLTKIQTLQKHKSDTKQQMKAEQIPKLINIKIQGEQSPFQTQISPTDTFLTLKNKLYISHEKIVDLVPYINGKIQIKNVEMGQNVVKWIEKFPDFVFLGFFGSGTNVIARAVQQAKNMGMSDQNIKVDYLKNFITPAIQSMKSLKLQQKIFKPNLSNPNPLPIPPQYNPSISQRITDLSYEQFNKLLNILKLTSGRYINQKLQVITSHKAGLTYNISENNYKNIIEDKGISHFFHNQAITEQSKEVYQQGFQVKELRNKVPYVFAFSLEQEDDYFQFSKGIQRIDYTYVQHCFPRGQANLITLQAVPQQELLQYFKNQDYSYKNILLFYKLFGQFFIKKFTIGLKRVCSQKIFEGVQAKNHQEIQKLASMAAGRIRQYMLQTNTQYSQGDKKTIGNTKSHQQIHYDIKAIGGAIEHCQNVALWKQSVNIWELWRVISVEQTQRVQSYLPVSVQLQIQKTLDERMKNIYDFLNSNKTIEAVLAQKFIKRSQITKIESNFETLISIKQKIYQILSLNQQNIILILKDKKIKYNLTQNRIDFQSQYKLSNKFFYGRQPGYVTACLHDNSVYIATEKGIMMFNFTNPKITFQIISQGNWRQSTLLIFYKNKLYANGWRGIYQINPKTGQYSIKIGGDWRSYTGTLINNNLYLFYWNIYCLDMDSMLFSKVSSGSWNQFWDNYTYPTNDWNKIWHVYRGKLYCFSGNQYFQVNFFKKGVLLKQFTTRSICYHRGSLLLSNFNQNQHLMRLPL